MKDELSLNCYKTFIFDCDGVVLDSNKVKTEAFYRATLPYGALAASAMVNYHISNGGVSRYKKFAYFLENIAPRNVAHFQTECNLKKLLNDYASHVRQGLLNCKISDGLRRLRFSLCDSKWLIVSGGDQIELRDVFEKRGICEYFDGGIFGSPETKDQILARQLASGSLEMPALFLGDSKYDYLAANAAGIDFIFLSDWTEMVDWQVWVSENNIMSYSSLNSILEIFPCG